MQYGGEIGLGPMVALQSINIISGKLACNGQVMLAMATARGVEYEVEEESLERCVILFTKGKLKYRASFEMEEARKIVTGKDAKGNPTHLADKDNWKNYPRDMMFWRTVARGVRRVDPAGVMGLYTPDELTGGDIVDVSEFKVVSDPKPSPKNIPPKTEDPPPKREPKIKDPPADDSPKDPSPPPKPPEQEPEPGEIVDAEFVEPAEKITPDLTVAPDHEPTQEEKWDREYHRAIEDIDNLNKSYAMKEWGVRHGASLDPMNPRIREIRAHYTTRLKKLKELEAEELKTFAGKGGGK